MSDTLPTPITNQEHFLNGIAGNEDVTNIPAITNEEKFLKYIALNGGGGGTSPFYPAGNIAFASLPNPSAETLGAMYNITDAFTTDSRFNEDAGIKYPAGTNVAVINTGTEQSPAYKFDTYAGAYTVDDAFSATSENPVQNKVVKAALDNKVDKVDGKGLSANDYTNSDKTLVNNFSIMWNTPGMHRMIFRGKNLGTSVSATQIAAIRGGSFDDLYIGDYWAIDNVNWRVADMDYWLGCGDTAFNSHHLVIVPDARLYNATMNDTNITTGGYVGSKMYTENLEQAKTKINSAFPNLVLPHREYLVNAVTNGKASGGAWYDSTVELMSENMIYGHREFTPGCDGTTIPENYTINKTQLALFMIAPNFITNRTYQWLRDVATTTAFARVSDQGGAACGHASYDCGVRPVFAIG